MKRFFKIPQYLLIPICMIFGGYMTAQKVQSVDVEVSGTVVNKGDAAPLRHAHVWVHEQADRRTSILMPDSAGKFSIRIPAGYYDVFVSAPGYLPFCTVIDTHDGKRKTFDIQLILDLEHFQQ